MGVCRAADPYRKQQTDTNVAAGVAEIEMHFVR
jgi:hypothetical protein